MGLGSRMPEHCGNRLTFFFLLESKVLTSFDLSISIRCIRVRVTWTWPIRAVQCIDLCRCFGWDGYVVDEDDYC